MDQHGKLTICGLGPGGYDSLTEQTKTLLLDAPLVYLRTEVHPVVVDLVKLGMRYRSFDALYETEDNFEAVYTKITDTILDLAETDDILYAVPGNPMCAETTVQKLIDGCKARQIDYEILPAVSFIDACMAAVSYDPINGLMILDALSLGRQRPVPTCAVLITQVYNHHVAGEVKLFLEEIYPDETLVALITACEDTGAEQVFWMPLYEMDRCDHINHLTSLFIPALEKDHRDLKALIDIMSALRAPDGCPWDRAQTHESLKKYLVEETREAIEAIDHQDIDNLIEELGDVLYQVVFHAQIGKEKGYFDMGDVIQGICEKMIRRHPHVFSGVTCDSVDDVNALWAEIKKQEKSEKGKK